MATDVKPNATPHTDYKSLVEKLKHQWNQGSIKSKARLGTYIGLHHIIDFISGQGSEEVSHDELTQLGDMERSLIGQWRDVRRLVGDERKDLNTDVHKLMSALSKAVRYTRRNSVHFT